MDVPRDMMMENGNKHIEIKKIIRQSVGLSAQLKIDVCQDSLQIVKEGVNW